MEINNLDLPSQQQVTQSQNKVRKVIIITLILFVVFSCGVLIGKYVLNDKKNSVVGTEVLPVISPSVSPNLSPTVIRQITNLPNLLKDNCDDNLRINLEILPFTLNEIVKKKYGITETVPCHYAVKDNRIGGYVRLENRIKDENQNIPISTLKIGTIDSLDNAFGEEDFSNFDKISETFLINENKIVVDILQPGPYGLSNNGVWLEVRGYRKVGEFLVIGKEFIIVKPDSEINVLFEKYKDIYTTPLPTTFPQITVHDKYEQFKSEFIQKYFIPYPNNPLQYKSMIDNVIADINSVGIK